MLENYKLLNLELDLIKSIDWGLNIARLSLDSATNKETIFSETNIISDFNDYLDSIGTRRLCLELKIETETRHLLMIHSGISIGDCLTSSNGQHKDFTVDSVYIGVKPAWDCNLFVISGKDVDGCKERTFIKIKTENYVSR
jgi:hypothetical protein